MRLVFDSHLLRTGGHFGSNIVGEDLQLPVRHLDQLLTGQQASHLGTQQQ